jgi:splicing factor, arginine/serine-rich 4/5/6
MSTRVYLGRLARDCRDRDIEKLFRGYGDIREINLKNGFGFVEFRDNRDAEDVVYDFHGKEFLGERYNPPILSANVSIVSLNLSCIIFYQTHC